MITIILGMLIGALKLGHDFHSLGARGIELIFTGILGAIFGGLLSLPIVLATSVICPKIETKAEPLNLVSVKSHCGPAYVYATSDYYSLMVLDPDGSMYPIQVKTKNNVHIREDSDLKDRGYYQATVRSTDKSNILYYFTLDSHEVIREDIRVPAGTVVRNFTIE